MTKLTACPTCGETGMTEDTRDVTHTVNGKEILVKAVKGNFCDKCGEVVTDADESRRVMRILNKHKASTPLPKEEQNNEKVN